MKRNRWLIALSAVGIHICIGSVYAWSVLTKPVMAAMGLSLGQTTWAFSIAILFLGLSAGFLGGFVERMGPSRSGLLSACFFALGMLGTGYAISVLRIYRRDWSGNRIYYSGIHSGQVVSKAQRICHWYGHHGIWICRTDCRTGYATSYGSLWTGQ